MNLNEYGIILSSKTLEHMGRLSSFYLVRYENYLDGDFKEGISNLFFMCDKKIYYSWKVSNYEDDIACFGTWN
jgi:hypothetical protein